MMILEINMFVHIPVHILYRAMSIISPCWRFTTSMLKKSIYIYGTKEK